MPPRGGASAFEPYSYNELRRTNPDGTVTSEFHSKFINYLDAHDTWQPIDLAFEQEGEGFRVTAAPYELHAGARSTDDIRFVSTNRFDVHTDTVREDAPLGKTRRFTNVRTVDGTVTDRGVLYAGALPELNASLLLQPHEMEARYLVVWDAAPAACAGSVEISFEETYDEGMPLMRNGDPIPSEDTELAGGYSVSRNSFRGIGTPAARIWDSAGKVADIAIVGQYADGVFRGKKVVPCDFFRGAVYPVYTDDTSTFYPDANPETTTFDGLATTINASWDSAHDATASTYVDDSSSNIEFLRTALDGNYVIARGFALSIPQASRAVRSRVRRSVST